MDTNLGNSIIIITAAATSLGMWVLKRERNYQFSCETKMLFSKYLMRTLLLSMWMWAFILYCDAEAVNKNGNNIFLDYLEVIKNNTANAVPTHFSVFWNKKKKNNECYTNHICG